MKLMTILLLLAVFPIVFGQIPADDQQFIRVEAPVIVLTHIRIIDGTGAEPHSKIKRSSRRWKNYGHITQQQLS
jgi:hypothetical protein